ncbi:hypothetical protein BH20ACI4_BH20ACI4_07250 [soil metagenome]
MEDFKINYDGGEGVQGIWIPIRRLDEGIEYVKKNKIADVYIWADGSTEKHTIDFDFLEEMKFLKSFHFAASLSKNSDITGIYSLENVKDFGWNATEKFPIDFANLSQLESLRIYHFPQMTNFESLQKLKKFSIQSIKAKDLTFIEKLNRLEKLSLLRGDLISTEGLKKLENLKEVELRYLSKLVNIEDLALNPNVRKLSIEACKKLTDYSVLSKNEGIEFLSVFYSKIDSLKFVKEMKSIDYVSFSDLTDGDLMPLLQSKTLSEVRFYPQKKHYSHSEEEINELLKKKS